MSDMSLLERLEFITEKAKQIINRTSFITDYHQFLVSPDAMDLFDATVLRLQVVGEMLKQIDDITRGQLLIPNYPEIPWRAVFGLRNFISHEYAMVDPEKIFYTVKEDIPFLLQILERIADDFRTGKHEGAGTSF